jgi:hypothetical protein
MCGNTVHLGCAELMHLVVDLSLQRAGFDPVSVHMEFVVDRMTLGFSLSSLVFPCHYSIILHSHVLFIYH